MQHVCMYMYMYMYMYVICTEASQLKISWTQIEVQEISNLSILHLYDDLIGEYNNISR